MLEILKNLVRKTPVLGPVVLSVSRRLRAIDKGSFTDTASYWEERYAKGGNSGGGSYNRLAEFKAIFLNEFLKKEGIESAIEFGCGDGNQLGMINYPKYTGLDVSKTVIETCLKKYEKDSSKSFFLYNPLAFRDAHGQLTADLSLSLDVIYHIVEDELFEKYLRDVFGAGKMFVVIYSSNFDSYQNKHVKNRNFSKFVDAQFLNYKLHGHVKNPYQYSELDEVNTSLADFYIYKRV
jgi:SAM-dependent methyltransferase